MRRLSRLVHGRVPSSCFRLILASCGLQSTVSKGAAMIASDRFNGLSRRSAIIISALIVVGFAHHTDHVLRVDHSGWPFRHDVNPFTFSLLAYPILLFALEVSKTWGVMPQAGLLAGRSVRPAPPP